jgi:hypothetical protein
VAKEAWGVIGSALSVQQALAVCQSAVFHRILLTIIHRTSSVCR